MCQGVFSIDELRHAAERLEPVHYLTLDEVEAGVDTWLAYPESLPA